MIKNKKLTVTLIVYTIVFFSAWAFFELLIAGRIEAAVSPIVSDLIKDCIAKTLIWSVPAVILIRKFKDDLNFKELFLPKKGWNCFGIFFAAFTVFILVNKWRTSGKIALSEDFSPLLLIVYLFVGINEELVFRGWLLNSTLKGEEFSEQLKPILINAVMFLLIHFPIWIKNGDFFTNLTSGAFIFITVLSVAFSYSFVKSKNIIVPALLHMWWDFFLTSLA